MWNVSCLGFSVSMCWREGCDAAARRVLHSTWLRVNPLHPLLTHSAAWGLPYLRKGACAEQQWCIKWWGSLSSPVAFLGGCRGAVFTRYWHIGGAPYNCQTGRSGTVVVVSWIPLQKMMRGAQIMGGGQGAQLSIFAMGIWWPCINHWLQVFLLLF